MFLLIASTFASGAAALACEILFARFLGHFLGHGAFAIISVLISFMGGMAAGNAFFGWRIREDSKRPVGSYVLLEMGIGSYALVFPFVIATLHHLFVSLAPRFEEPIVVHSLKMAISVLAVCFPTFLMGGTIPAAVAIAGRSIADSRKRLSLLYFGNTAGGVFGCLVTNFLLIPRFGLNGSLVAASILNGLALTLAICFAKTNYNAPNSSQKNASGVEVSMPVRRLVLACLAVSGFVAMLYELVWTRMLALILGSTTDAFAIVLATLLAGIALGSAVVSWRASRANLKSLGSVQVTIALAVIALAFTYSRLPYIFEKLTAILASTPNAYSVYVLLQAIISAIVLAGPAMLAGSFIPLSIPFVSQAGPRSGVGSLLFWNTVGALLGIVATGLWLLPSLGLARTLGLGAALNLAAGLLLHARASGIRGLQMAMASIVGLIVIPLSFGMVYAPRWERAFSLGLWRQPSSISSVEELNNIEDQNQLKFYKDGVISTVSVNRWIAGDQEQLVLRVNGKPDASSGSDMATQILLAHIPMLLTASPVENALVIGLGSGITSGAVARYSSVKRIDTVEISKEVISAARLFAPYNGDILNDSKLHLINDDARAFVETTSRFYDVILSEPSNPWIAGVADVFTREFYVACEERLADGGLMAQWLHLYDNSPEAIAIALKTFASVFHNVSIWQTEELDILLIGSAKPMMPNLDAFIARFREPSVRSDLHRIRLHQPLALLSLQLTSTQKTSQLLSAQTPLHTENHPILEFETQRAFFEHRTASEFLSVNENRTARSNCLIAEYLREHPITAEDYDAIAEFYLAFRIPSVELLRTICIRWQNDPEARGRLLRWLPDLPQLGTVEELEALRLSALRETLLKSADSNPRLLEHYGNLLMTIYRSQRSVFYLPTGSECRAVHERLLQINGVDHRMVRSRLDEMAFDHGDLKNISAPSLRLEQKTLF